MLNSLNDVVSTMSGVFILIFSFLVIRLYWKLAANIYHGKELDDPGSWFAHGIVMGFSAVALNAFFWKFTYRLSKLMGQEDFIYLVAQYGGFFDFGIFLITMWAGFCHLYSAYLNLTPDQRHGWLWVTIPWYPNTNLFTRCIARMLKQNMDRKD